MNRQARESEVVKLRTDSSPSDVNWHNRRSVFVFLHPSVNKTTASRRFTEETSLFDSETQMIDAD